MPEEGAMFMNYYKQMEGMIGKMGKSPLLRGKYLSLDWGN